ncbi:MAG: hypothetical protein LBP78_01515 [Acidaminococcales bacterium]|nr:hypothetical protein [Acidaminococcales bacterium]
MNIILVYEVELSKNHDETVARRVTSGICDAITNSIKNGEIRTADSCQTISSVFCAISEHGPVTIVD